MGYQSGIVYRMGHPVEVGYGIADVCNEGGCIIDINRGESHLCGAMHGGDEWGCAHYFCDDHLFHAFFDNAPHIQTPQLCTRCMGRVEAQAAEYAEQEV